MNVQQFLEEERNRYSKEYDNIVTEDGTIGELEADDLLEEHDTRLINFILSEVEREANNMLDTDETILFGCLVTIAVCMTYTLYRITFYGY